VSLQPSPGPLAGFEEGTASRLLGKDGMGKREVRGAEGKEEGNGLGMEQAIPFLLSLRWG